MARINRLLLIAAMLCCFYSAAVVIALYWPVSVILLGIVLFIKVTRQGVALFWAHGTARFASLEDVRRAGLLRGVGLPIGMLATMQGKSFWRGVRALFSLRTDARTACRTFLDNLPFRKAVAHGQPVHVNTPHTVTFAPAGSGKTTAQVINFLLDGAEQEDAASALVIDFKGELARITAEARRQRGQTLVLLDPYRAFTKNSATFNPLDFIRPEDPEAIDDCRDLAAALVNPSPHEREPHWPNRARDFIATVTAGVVRHGKPDDRSLQTVCRILADPRELKQFVAFISTSTAWGGKLAQMAREMTHAAGNELESILSTVSRFTSNLGTVAMAENTKTSSFDYADLKKRRITVYLILPPHRLVAQENWLRLHVSSALRAVVRQGPGGRKVRLILDEAACLGHMDAIDAAIALYRGYNVSVHSWFQSMGQLKTVYPDGKEQVLLGNTAQTFFGVNDNETAEYVSKRLGEYTLVVHSGNTNRGGSRTNPDMPTSQNGGSSGWSWGETQSWQQIPRRLLKPEEIMQLPADPQRFITAISCVPGMPAILTELVPYYRRWQYTPSLWRRFTGAVKRLIFSVVFLGLCLMLATWLTEIGLQQSQPDFQNDFHRFAPPERPVFLPPEQPRPPPVPVNPYRRR